MELFAEGGPYVIPDSRIDYPVMKQDHSFRSTATLLVVEPRAIDIDKCSRRICGCRYLRETDSTHNHRDKQQQANDFHPDRLCVATDRIKSGTVQQSTTIRPERLFRLSWIEIFERVADWKR